MVLTGSRGLLDSVQILARTPCEHGSVDRFDGIVAGLLCSRTAFDITNCDVKEKVGSVVSTHEFVTIAAIELAITELRGQRVLFDADLATMYGVETRSLIQAVRRNSARFPDDFMFKLSAEEWATLRPVQRKGRGGRRTPPYAFTQEGVAMLSSVLHSDRAINVNVQIMRAFVRMKEVLMARSDISRRLDELETKYDAQFGVVFEAIRQLVTPPPSPRTPIGFRPPDDSSG